MTDISSHIESSPIPSIKSLKYKFEQFALDNASVSSKPNLISPAPTLLQAQTVEAPKSAPSAPCFRLQPDDCVSQSQPDAPACDVRNKVSTSDAKAAALKRPPPPPPLSKIKKPAPSPIVSPLLRPVPPPVALRTPSASLVCESFSVQPDHSSHGREERNEDGFLASVTSLRHRLSSPTPMQTSKPPSPRPVTPRPPPRPPMVTSQSDPVTVEHTRPVLPPRHAKPIALDISLSPSLDISAETSSPSIITPDASPRAGHVAALRDRFLSKDACKPRPHDSLSTHSEPSILVSGLQALHVRHPRPRPSSSSLFAGEVSLELTSSSNSSVYSPFSDDESEISEISEICMSPAVQSSGSGEFASTGGILHHDGKHSSGSGEGLSDFSPSKPKPPPRPPPPPPRRPNGLSVSAPHESSLTGSATTTPTQLVVPLPARQVAQEENGAEVPSSAPPLPARPLISHGNTIASVESTSLFGERKPLGSARLPPPPTRTIGLGDKLPPVRRTHSLSSDEESALEEDPRVRSAESLPDSSRSSRRPPSLHYAGSLKIHVPAHSGHVAATGTGVVVASGHHINYHDLLSDGGPSWSLDTRDGMRGCLVSCVEFRPAQHPDDGGKYLWVGTKEGHLLEIDLAMGVFTSSKMGIHASQVTSIFRHGPTMITVDEAGKALIFDPNTNANAGVGAGTADDVNLVYTTPRVHRLGEKVEFVNLLGGLLWTAVRSEVNGAGMASLPTIRIHDVCAPGSIGCAVTPNHHAGAVTTGTMLPSHPDHVYLGHEGGYISVWNIATDDGIPICVEMVKVSASDVLCLEGVNDRLWVGGRKGTISVYDVSTKPWVVTNCWDAHGGLPVLRIFVDPYALQHMEKLIVVSVGRGEQVKFWDGFLGADRIEQGLLKREHAFSTFRDLKVLVVSWNVDAAKPESLIGDPENVTFLHDVLTSVDSPDIISFGFQEVIDLESRKMAAKMVLLGAKKKGEEGKINENVTSSYRRWHDQLIQAVMLAMPPESPYTVIHKESLVGLFTCMFVKKSVNASVRDPAIATIKRGVGGFYGNKGGIIARFVIDDSSLCLINCHLAAGQHHVRQRNADLAAFLETTNVFPVESTEKYGYVGGGDGSMVLDHEIVFLNGDMNYRIDQHREAVIAAVEANDLDAILMHDQLYKEMNYNRAFRLRTFHEGALTFAPTYKYDRNSSVYDTSEKHRVPAWCDRVLWRSRDEKRVGLMEYRRWEANVSDHRPVSAVFRVTVKKVVEEARAREKRVVETWWNETEVMLLAKAKAFYGV